MDTETLLAGMATHGITIQVDGLGYVAIYEQRGREIHMHGPTAIGAVTAAIESLAGSHECEQSGHVLPQGAESFDQIGAYICARCGTPVTRVP